MRAAIVLVALAAVVGAGAADARRIPSAVEDAAIDAALKAFRHPDVSALGPRWAALNRCSRRVTTVSTVVPGWAVVRFVVRRNVRCRRPGTQEGYFVARRMLARWAITGWIFGEYSGFCPALAKTKIPLRAFVDAVGPGFWSDC